MKQAGYTKRPMGRSPERQRPTHTRQSNGSSTDNKPRGNAQQCVEKYLTLARDATSLGDRISAENYYQYADHYHRLLIESRVARSSPPERKEEESRTPPTAPEPPVTQSQNLFD